MAQQKTNQPPAKSGGNRTLLLVGGVIVAAGAAWVLLSGGGGGSIAAVPTPAEFEAMVANLEGDPAVGIALGSEAAPITLEEFYDFSCPACAAFSGFAGKLIRQNYTETANGPVRWVSYDYVLGSFPNSVPAAMAGRCANEQGQYWAVHDLLLARQTRWYLEPNPAAPLAEIAEAVGLDMGAYNECMSDTRYVETIAQSRKYGDTRGVGSTPTIFIDGEMLNLNGQPDPYSYIEGIIQAKLAAMETDAEQ